MWIPNWPQRYGPSWLGGSGAWLCATRVRVHEELQQGRGSALGILNYMRFRMQTRVPQLFYDSYVETDFSVLGVMMLRKACVELAGCFGAWLCAAQACPGSCDRAGGQRWACWRG